MGILALVLVLLPPLGPTAPAPEDERLWKLWRNLPEESRFDLCARFSAEVEGLDTLQNRLLQSALALDERDPGFLPVDAPAPFFDPEVHAPDLPIERVRLDPGDSRAQRALKKILGEARASERARRVWRYDWGAGEVFRAGDPDAPDHVFAEALAGRPPGADLARALLERALDGGEEREVLRGFEHAYTDREGNVYPGLTLYDAWSSGRKMEMPDVDNLGLVHELLEERRKWKSPVPESKQDSLYQAVAELFAVARDYRDVRAELARSFLTGSWPEQPNAHRLHGLWLAFEADPARLSEELPGVGEIDGFLAQQAVELEEDLESRAAAHRRLQTLDSDARRVRDLMLSLLEEYAARER